MTIIAKKTLFGVHAQVSFYKIDPLQFIRQKRVCLPDAAGDSEDASYSEEEVAGEMLK